MYITKELIRGRLYVSTEVSVAPGSLRRPLSEGRNEGDPRLRRYWSNVALRSQVFSTDVKSDKIGGIGPISGIESKVMLRR